MYLWGNSFSKERKLDYKRQKLCDENFSFKSTWTVIS